jgi:hypothetical protein
MIDTIKNILVFLAFLAAIGVVLVFAEFTRGNGPSDAEIRGPAKVVGE